MSDPQTILIVEDQIGFRQIYQDVLESFGYTVLTAEDGEVGWAMMREQKPDLVLLDLGLPKITGLEILEMARADEKTRTLPIMIFSVMGEQKEVDKAMKLGANDYILKGFTSNREIVEKIKKFLAGIKKSVGMETPLPAAAIA